MILNCTSLRRSFESLDQVRNILAGMREENINPRNYAVLAEGAIDTILSLRRDIDDYLGIPPGPAPDGHPPASTNLRATALTNREVDLAWDDPAAGPTSEYWVVQSSDGGSTWETVGRPRESALHIADLEPNTRYLFKVRGRNVDRGGDSAISNIFEVTTPVEAPDPRPTAPVLQGARDLAAAR